MCCCASPNINGQPGYSWDGKTVGVRPVDPPALGERDTLLFDLPGRCGGMDSHCHHYRVVASGGSQFGQLALLVRHGAGDQRIRLSLPRGVELLTPLTETSRYWLVNAIFHAEADGRMAGRASELARWRDAAAEKRIKVRKVRGKDAVSVSIEPRRV